MDLLTIERVLALAPDAASAKAGQGLARSPGWSGLGRGGDAVWGECQGSGKTPYRLQADLRAPAFQCSCPSRKFPCKHGLGLLLILAANPERIPVAAEPPAWVNEWQAKRAASAAAKTAKAAGGDPPKDPETLARQETDRARRAERREDRVRAGLGDLQIWLSDVLRAGLAQARQQPLTFWDEMAARMVDAQAPGLARRLRAWPGIFASGDGWADRALTEAGLLQWLLHGYAHLESLSPELQVSVRAAIGWTGKEEPASETRIRDRWQVIGQRVEEEDRLRVQRTWLVGAESGRRALSLSFAPPGQPLDLSLPVGWEVEADLALPSATSLRGTVVERHGSARPCNSTAACANFAEALAQTAAWLAADPWAERVPWLVGDCVSERAGERWQLRDKTGAIVPLARTFANPWSLHALSGGSPLTVFGEWSGAGLLPLSAQAEGRLVALEGVAR